MLRVVCQGARVALSVPAIVLATLLALCGPAAAQYEIPESALSVAPDTFTQRFVQYMGGPYFSGFIADYLMYLAPRRAQGCPAPTGIALTPHGIMIVSERNASGEYEFEFSDDGRPLNLIWLLNVSVDYCGTQVAERFHFHSSSSGALSVRDSSLGMPYTDARRPAALAETRRQIEQLLERGNPRRNPPSVELDVEHSYPGDDDEDLFD